MRVQRSFAFVDLSGFTAFTEARGDERAVSVLEEFRSSVRKTCSRRAVRIAKWLGDGAMLVGVECTPLVAAALEIQSTAGSGPHPMAVRCGVSVGAVILLEGDDYIGHSVNVAARLCDMAAPGEVLATSDVVPHLPPWGTELRRELGAIKGLGRPVEIVSLGVRTPGREAAPDPVCGLMLSPGTAPAKSAGDHGPEMLFCSESCLETWNERARDDEERTDGDGDVSPVSAVSS